MAAPATRFEELVVWQKSHALVLRVYKETASFPKTELYCLVQQMRRAAIAVPANIAEGFKKRGRDDKLRYYNIAQGSLEELRYYVILARDLSYIPASLEIAEVEEAARLLNGYIQAVRTRS